MNCPKCGKKTKIIDSRVAGDRTVVSKEHEYTGSKVRRRHQCKCGIRFSTIEVLCEILPAQFPPENRYRKPKPKHKPKKPKAKPNNDWLERINRKLEEV
jgi:transcriptional regulator NrdR family protein